MEHLQACPFIAVLRGVQGTDVAPTLQALAAEGWTLASIPAEAPAGLGALSETGAAAAAAGGDWDMDMMLGAATVVSVEQVDRAAEAGAAFVSCPHVDPEIIERCVCVYMCVCVCVGGVRGACGGVWVYVCACVCASFETPRKFRLFFRGVKPTDVKAHIDTH
jgi:2-keto-3-deoxy-6-phosphogluconate aldolase